MIEYSTLGLDYFTLFACLRLAIYGSMMSPDILKETTAMCDLTRHTILIKYCASERTADWKAYCYALYTSGNKIDCENPNVAAVNSIEDKLANSPGSKQWACLKRLRGG